MTTQQAPESLYVGITGHRFLAELPRLLESLECALDLLEDTFQGRELVCISSLAEGADRLAAEAVIDRPGGGLVAVLPFDQMEYEQDFEDS